MFIALFIPLAVVDGYMDKVQWITRRICGSNRAPVHPLGEMLNPDFVRFALPITLGKWAVAGYFAWVNSWVIAAVALVVSWLATITLPIPIGLILSPIRKKIARVKDIDAGVGGELERMLAAWLGEDQGRVGET